MLSESARMSSAAEVRFRIRTAMPTGRVVKVFALDPASEAIVARLAEGPWDGTTFVTAAVTHQRNVADDVAGADLVVMVAAAGGDADAARTIGEACSRTRVMTTTIVVRSTAATEEALSKTLAQVRPWSLMVAIAGDEGYVEDILRSFR